MARDVFPIFFITVSSTGEYSVVLFSSFRKEDLVLIFLKEWKRNSILLPFLKCLHSLGDLCLA